MGETKSAIVTGGAHRIGRAIAIGLAERGFDVGVNYLSSEDKAKETCQAIEAIGRKCVLLQGDLAQPGAAATLMKEACAKLENIEVLVNNASVFDAVGLLETTEELFDRNFAIHVRAPFFLCAEFAKSCQRGLAVNITDALVERDSTEYFAYLLSKKALHAFTRMAAKELAPAIRVNAIAPGSTLEPVDAPGSGYLEERAQQVPLKMAGHPKYLMSGIDYFLGNPFVTGECLFIDGGAHVEF